jgi:LDH2 family malate/lactate/ureidoglycolate dehydrogenase
MPFINHNDLRNFITQLMQAYGASEDEALLVSEHTVEANLVGHDSHGVIQIPTYIDRIQRGHIKPGVKIEVTNETRTTARINGNWGFGYHVSDFAMKLAIKKAREDNIAAITVVQQSHVGRVASYPLMAAKEGLIAIMTADSGRGPKMVVPFGGKERKLGTNPICIAFPSNLEGTMFIDMATSSVAAGKINLARSRNENIPQGWIIDKDGNQTNDPNDFSQGGAILPLGADQGHKGYGLSAAVETFSGILTGLGFGVSKDGIHNDGCLMIVMNVEAFRDLEVFKQEVTEFALDLSSTEPASGFERVYYPGEIEHVTKQERIKTGIFVEEATVSNINKFADDSDVKGNLDVYLQ